MIEINPELFKQQYEYCVYEHVTPANERYVGMTKNAKRRFMSGGNGYSGSPKMKAAIEKYGWEKIKHNIIVDGLTRAQAQKLEKYLIDALKLIDKGLNTSKGGEAGASLYSKHVQHMIRESKRYNNPHINEFFDMLSTFSDNEAAAANVNFLDMVIQNYIDEYKQLCGDQYMQTAVYIYYLKAGIVGKDITKIPRSSEAIMEVLKNNDSN